MSIRQPLSLLLKSNAGVLGNLLVFNRRTLVIAEILLFSTPPAPPFFPPSLFSL